MEVENFIFKEMDMTFRQIKFQKVNYLRNVDQGDYMVFGIGMFSDTATHNGLI